MKKSRSALFLCLAAGFLVLAALLHLRLLNKAAHFRATSEHAAEKAAAQLRDVDGLVKRVDESRVRYRDLLEQVVERGPGGPAIQAEEGIPPPQPNNRNARIGASPDMRQASIEAYVADQKLAFGGLLKLLRLSPDQVKRFDAIQAESQSRFLDVAVAANERRLGPNSPEIAALRTENRKWEENAYRQLFGSDYDKWVEGTTDLGTRRVVSVLAESSYTTSRPLTASQATALTALLDQHQRTENGRTEYDWEPIFQQAGSVLSPDQLDGFKDGVEFMLVKRQRDTLRAQMIRK